MIACPAVARSASSRSARRCRSGSSRNDEIAPRVDTSDEWIRARTGIPSAASRRPTSGRPTSRLRGRRSRRSTAPAWRRPQIDLVIARRASPDALLPVHRGRRGRRRSARTPRRPTTSAAACTGFPYALIAGRQPDPGRARASTRWSIGAETLSKVLDWDDRATCILFGDGAGAVVISADALPSEHTLGDRARRRRLARRRPLRRRAARPDRYIEMNGGEVFRFATTVMVDRRRSACWSGLRPRRRRRRLVRAAPGEPRIIDHAVERLGDRPGARARTSSATATRRPRSIPLCLDEAWRATGASRPGDRLLMVGFGGGLTWGSCLTEWAAAAGRARRAEGLGEWRRWRSASRARDRRRSGWARAMAAAFPPPRACSIARASALGFDLAAVCFDGPLERLSQTEMTQPALTATSLACLAAVREAGVEPDYVVGHSVGEYAALVAAGAIGDERRACVLVRERGLAMAEAAARGAGRDGGGDRARRRARSSSSARASRACGRPTTTVPGSSSCPAPRRASPRLIEAATAAGARRARAPQRVRRLPLAAHGVRPSGGCGRRSRRSTFHEPVDPVPLDRHAAGSRTRATMAPILVRPADGARAFTQAVERARRAAAPRRSSRSAPATCCPAS